MDRTTGLKESDKMLERGMPIKAAAALAIGALLGLLASWMFSASWPLFDILQPLVATAALTGLAVNGTGNLSLELRSE